MMRSNMTEMPGLHLVIYGLLLIAVMIFYPGGFAEFYRKAARWVKEKRGTQQKEN
jgi:ABC-type branched-subunit amino acid transport system permease subunit